MNNNKLLPKAEEKRKRRGQKMMWKRIKGVLLWAVPLIIVAALAVWVFTLPKKSDSQVISRYGIHIHPSLFIRINGEGVTVPGNIGLGRPIPLNIHTHNPDNILHVEKNGIVRERDITVANFFRIWRKDFSGSSILGNENGPQGTVRMFVNGEENFEFEKYQMRDRDRIEIIYE